MELFDPQGRRLYLTAEERETFIETANNTEREVRTFCPVLACTGCRISEALALAPRSFDFSGRAIVFETLKKRRAGVYRAVPMPQISWIPSRWCTVSKKAGNASERGGRRFRYGPGRGRPPSAGSRR
jgi:integrase